VPFTFLSPRSFILQILFSFLALLYPPIWIFAEVTPDTYLRYWNGSRWISWPPGAARMPTAPTPVGNFPQPSRRPPRSKRSYWFAVAAVIVAVTLICAG